MNTLPAVVFMGSRDKPGYDVRRVGGEETLAVRNQAASVGGFFGRG